MHHITRMKRVGFHYQFDHLFSPPSTLPSFLTHMILSDTPRSHTRLLLIDDALFNGMGFRFEKVWKWSKTQLLKTSNFASSLHEQNFFNKFSYAYPQKGIASIFNGVHKNESNWLRNGGEMKHNVDQNYNFTFIFNLTINSFNSKLNIHRKIINVAKWVHIQMISKPLETGSKSTLLLSEITFQKHPFSLTNDSLSIISVKMLHKNHFSKVFSFFKIWSLLASKPLRGPVFLKKTMILDSNPIPISLHFCPLSQTVKTLSHHSKLHTPR